MTEDAQLKKNKKRKLDPRAYIGYLVGYDSTNIFRIWIPHKEASRQMIAEMDSLIARVQLPKAEATNERILEEDEEVLEPLYDSDDDESTDEGVAAFDEKEDYKLIKALEDTYLTLLFLEIDLLVIFHV